MNKKVKKAYREKYKEIYGEYPEARFVPGDGTGRMPHISRKDGKITNQKGAFGKVNVQPTFDPNETNKMRFDKRKALAKKKIESKTRIANMTKGLLTKVLGE